MNDKPNIAPIARAVCAALGATLSHDNENERYARAVYADGVTLGLYLTFNKRLEVSANMPGQCSVNDVIEYEEKNRGTFTTRISVDCERAPDALARDITRRLLPDAKTLHARALARNKSNQEWAEAREATAVWLAKRLGVERRRDWAFYPGGVSLTVQGPDSVAFDRTIYCTAKTAAKIVELLKGDKSGE